MYRWRANSWTLATLPQGAVVGTSSLRRQAQLLAVRPDLTIRPIRGNVDTRLRKVHTGEYDATVMAQAGLNRLGLSDEISECFSWETMLPAPGQGALAVQCREDDTVVCALLAALHVDGVALAVDAERQLLQQLGGGCSAPIGAAATIASGCIHLRGRVTALDGSATYEAAAKGESSGAVAATVAAALRDQGAGNVLARLRQPLKGKRIVVTRAADQADDLSSRLRDFGAEVVEIPAIEIAPLEDQSPLQAALGKLDQYAWILFTSTNAVHVFVSEMQKSSAPLRVTPKIAAVGPATRHALEQLGLDVTVQPARYLGTEIIAGLGDIDGRRILLPRSVSGRAELPRLLTEAGAQVDEIAIYATVPALLSEESVAELLRGVDVVTFASGSAARAFYDSISRTEALPSLLANVTRACIGPSTAEVLAELGIPADVVAADHTAAGLVDALAHHFDQKFDQEA